MILKLQIIFVFYLLFLLRKKIKFSHNFLLGVNKTLNLAKQTNKMVYDVCVIYLKRECKKNSSLLCYGLHQEIVEHMTHYKSFPFYEIDRAL